MTPVQVRQDGTIWRVVESDGAVCMHNRNPSDGGGFSDRGAADKLAEDINGRRERAV